VHPFAAHQETDPARPCRELQPRDERRRLEVADVDLGLAAGEDDPDAEPVVERERDRRPETVVMVELPARDPVEDGCVLHRVRVPDLVRADVERLEVLVVAGAPDHAVEAALPTHPELELDRSVLELSVQQHGRVTAGQDARAPSKGRRAVLGVRPVPRVRVERDDHLQ
jgi:hypothetical protein